MNFEEFSKKFKEKNDTLENVKKLSREIFGESSGRLIEHAEKLFKEELKKETK